MKTCSRCLRSLPLDAFALHKTGKHGRRGRCRTCVSTDSREYNKRLNEERRARYREDHDYRERVKQTNRLVNYKMTNEGFESLFDRQGRRCAICQTDVAGGRGMWHIDHDHSCCVGPKTCGLCVRGVLCSPCNTGMGHFRDDVDRLMSAAAYLLQFRDALAPAVMGR